MKLKLQPKSFPLPNWSLFRVSGADAKDLLQRISTQDFERIESDAFLPACFLSATGAIESLHWVKVSSDGTYEFAVDGGPNGARTAGFQEYIDRYTFAEAIAIKLIKDALLVWNAAAKSPQLSDTPADGSSTDLDKWRIEHLAPAMGAEITERTLPLEVGLVAALAEKGCYPGQEVVERIRSRGEPARRLARIVDIREGAEVSDDIPAATLTTRSGSDGLAIVRKVHAKPNTDVRLSEGIIGIISMVAPF